MSDTFAKESDTLNFEYNNNMLNSINNNNNNNNNNNKLKKEKRSLRFTFFFLSKHQYIKIKKYKENWGGKT
jgi:hypothetical protein